jgi:hypothetical protein
LCKATSRARQPLTRILKAQTRILNAQTAITAAWAAELLAETIEDAVQAIELQRSDSLYWPRRVYREVGGRLAEAYRRLALGVTATDGRSKSRRAARHVSRAAFEWASLSWAHDAKTC